jgi:hypothetical protein
LRQLENYLKLYPKGKVKVKFRYITVFREFGIDSEGGPEEIKQDIRQILIQKYYPDKFWDYLDKFRQRKKIEDICQELNINADELESRFDEGMALLKEDFGLCEQLSIRDSPQFLWENQILIPFIDLLKEFISKRVEIGVSQPSNKETIANQSSKDRVVQVAFFYEPRCPVCHEMMNNYIPVITQKYGKSVKFEFYDMTARENFEKNLELEEKFAVLGGGVPRIYVGSKVMIGRSQIERELENTINQLLSEKETKELSEWKQVTMGGNEKKTDRIVERFKTFAPMAIISAGLLDGINPCAFSTIVFFISFLAFAGYNRKQMIAVGLSFTLAVFFTYLALGLGAFAGLQRLNAFSLFQKYFDKIVAILALGLGVASVYDYILYKITGRSEGMLLQLPQSIKNRIHNTVRVVKDKEQKRLAAILVSAFSVGVIVSFLEAVCTGQLYLPTITFMLKMNMFWRRAFLFLLLYNTMFVVPLLIVLVLALFGISSQFWTKVVGRNLGRVKIVTAIFFFAMAALILLWK